MEKSFSLVRKIVYSYRFLVNFLDIHPRNPYISKKLISDLIDQPSDYLTIEKQQIKSQ